MSINATIQDLAVNTNAKLTPMVIKNLVDVVNREFDRQKTLYDATASAEREKILEKYKKSIGYTALKAKYDKALGEQAVAAKNIQDAENVLKSKGLTINGDEYTFYSNQYCYQQKSAEDVVIEKACKKVKQLLEVVETAGPDNVRNKIVSRLWISSTVGEAMVILRDVLGNGIIPTLSKEDVKAISYEG